MAVDVHMRAVYDSRFSAAKFLTDLYWKW